MKNLNLIIFFRLPFKICIRNIENQSKSKVIEESLIFDRIVHFKILSKFSTFVQRMDRVRKAKYFFLLLFFHRNE